LDTCFIISWDLLALSKEICAWRFIKDRRPSRSKILNEYSSHQQRGRGGEENPEANVLTGDGARSQPDDPPAGTSWKSSKKEEDTHLRDIIQAKHFIKERYVQRAQSPLTSSRTKYNYKFITTKETKITRKD
jgi:hypothetical protein